MPQPLLRLKAIDAETSVRSQDAWASALDLLRLLHWTDRGTLRAAGPRILWLEVNSRCGRAASAHDKSPGFGSRPAREVPYALDLDWPVGGAGLELAHLELQCGGGTL
jgi:hypothetical protein